MIRAELLIFFPTKLFFSGERVTGYVELRLPAPMGIQGVKINVYGREYYTNNMQEALKTNSNNRVTKIFFDYSTKLDGQGSSKKEESQFFGLFQKKVNTILQPGVYRYDFDIPLPDFLPPTYRTNMSAITGTKSTYGLPSVDYEIRCTCINTDKAIGDLVSSAALPIGGSLMTPSFMGGNTTPFSDSKVKTFMFASGSITTSIQLPTKVFLTGDHIFGQLTVENSSQKIATDVELSFIQRVDCLKSGYKVPLKSDVYVIKRIILGELKQKEKKVIILNQNTGIKIPDFCVESIFTQQKMGTLVNVNYFLKVTGKLSLATDLDYEAAIYVANRSRHAPYLQQQMPIMQPMMAASPSMSNSNPQFVNNQPQVTSFQQPPQQYQQPPQQMQQYVQPQQQTLQRAQSVYDDMKQFNEDVPSVESSAPPEQEATEYYDYQDDQNNMNLYPTIERGISYNLPPIPVSAYEFEARKQLQEEQMNNLQTGQVPQYGYNVESQYENMYQ